MEWKELNDAENNLEEKKNKLTSIEEQNKIIIMHILINKYNYNNLFSFFIMFNYFFC